MVDGWNPSEKSTDKMGIPLDIYFSTKTYMYVVIGNTSVKLFK